MWVYRFVCYVDATDQTVMKATFFWLSVGLAPIVQSELLAPTNDILFPSSKTSQNPLKYAGGNSPYFAGQITISLDAFYVAD
jgi:hypothetical protein